MFSSLFDDKLREAKEVKPDPRKDDRPLVNTGGYTLITLVNYVESYLDTEDLESPIEYFIAGGSCASALLHHDFSEIKDVDIFFETQHDLNLFEDCLIKHDKIFTSKNAITYKENNSLIRMPQIQLICLNFGNPIKHLKSFDLNKSKIGITNDGVIYEDDSYDTDLEFNNELFRTSTADRLLKYNSKGFPLTLKTINNVFKLLLIDRNKDFIEMYTIDGEDGLTDIEVGTKGSEIFKKFITNIYTSKGDFNFEYNDFLEVLYQSMIYVQSLDEKYTEDDIISFFQKTGIDKTYLHKYDEVCISTKNYMDKRTPVRGDLKTELGETRYKEFRRSRPEEFI